MEIIKIVRDVFVEQIGNWKITFEKAEEGADNCQKFCPFTNSCHLMKDPRNLGDEKSTFMDYCNDKFEDNIILNEELDDKEIVELENYYPAKIELVD